MKYSVVYYWPILTKSTQDTADGEFSRVKTRLALHTVRHHEDNPGYIEVCDSESFKKFGEQQMSIPGPQSKLKFRKFFNMKPEEIMERKKKVQPVKTLAGIKSKYQYICLPNGKVMWRRYPCCCTSCLELCWDLCTASLLVGKLETVNDVGDLLYTSPKTGEKGLLGICFEEYHDFLQDNLRRHRILTKYVFQLYFGSLNIFIFEYSLL